MTTTNTAPTAKGRRSIALRLLIWSLYGVGFLVVALVAVLIWLVVRDRSANARLQEQIGELKAARLPYDNASLPEYYAQGTEQRDVDRWLAVLATIESDAFTESAGDIGPWKTAEPFGEPTEETRPDEAETWQFLQTWSELRSEARALALQDRKVRLPLEFAFPDTDLHLAQDVRQLGRLFVVETQVAIRERDSAAARDAILAILGCARAVEGQPLMVSQLISTALERMAGEQVREALQADVLDTEDLKLVQARLDKRPSLAEVWKRAIDGERGSMLPVFTDLRRHHIETRGEDPGFVLPWRSHDALAFLAVTAKARELPTGDLNEFYGGTRELTDLMEQMFRGKSWLEQFDTIFCCLLMPAFAAGGEAFIQREMHARLTLLAIGVRLYEDKHGALPDRLDQLSDVGLDVSKLTPIGDKPFGYRKEDDRAILWGFELKLRQATPDEPPQAPETPSDNWSDRLPAQEKELWLWELPKGH